MPGENPRVDARNSTGVQVGNDNVLHIVNHYGSGSPEPDHAARGAAALRAKAYPTATAQLTAALDSRPADAEVHYHLALALLRGRRPHQVRSRTERGAIREHLALADQLSHARLLRVLVDEDLGRHWERDTSVPAALLDLVHSVQPDLVAELLHHVRAPRNRVWELLNRQPRTGDH